MSLVVWLPLNGDLHNQGLSDITVTNSGATIDNNGKIGKCYYFNASSYLKENTYDWTNFNTSEFSLCCWYKEPSPVASGNSQIICIGTNSGWNNIRIGLLRRTSSGYPMFSVSNGSSSVKYDFTASTFSFDTWNHIAVTYKNGELKMYLNGVLNKTSTTTIIPVLDSSQHLGIGAASNGVEQLTGYLNDIRIYDHALSAKEAEEIAKGLVLHYKLDQPANINYNLYTGSRNFTGTWVNNSAWITSLETYNGFTVKQKSIRWDGLAQNITATNGDIFTISFWGKVDSGGDIRSTHRSNLGNVMTGLTILDGNFSSSTNWVNTSEDGTQWKRYWATLRIDSTDITYLQWRIENSVADKNLYVAGMTLEKGYGTKNWSLSASEAGTTNIVYDSSGYGNNGTIVDSLETTTPSPRYSCATKFDGNTSGILIENLQLSDIINTAVTYSFWIKPNGENSARSIYFGSYVATSWSIEKTTGNKLRLYWNGSPDETSSAVITDGEWQHIVITKSGTSDIKVYLNGELTWTSTATHNNLTFPTTYRIGRDTRSGDGTPYNGDMSDFRIYATALTPAQVKELYSTSMSIDNNGNIHTRELIVEDINNISTNKRGQLLVNTAEEDAAIASFIKPNKIECDNLYEY